MDYKQTLEWLFSQLPMFQRIGKAAYKADLATTVELLETLGNPQNNFKAIHIAGTNGKGSVSHILASILQEAGFKTGLYTSPHLIDFRERIKINGQMINEKQVVQFVSSHKNTFEKIKPSFFEMTVGMAFDYFAKEKVDFAVLETGMGGRLDSTNICKPVVCCITNIGYDHMQYLGESLEEIAAEKAGIVKEAIPLVVGRTQLETRPIFEKITTEKRSPLVYADQHFDLREVQTRGSKFLTFDVWRDNQMFLEKLDSPLLGKYQQENIATALQTIEVLNEETGISIDEQTMREGIENVVRRTGLQGRWQILSTNPLTICDTGHNSDGIRAIINQLSQTSYDHLHFVFGMVNDKDPENILSLLPKNATYYFSKPDIPRGLDAEILKEKAFKAGLRGESYNSVQHALNSAINNAKVNDLVFIGGSTFVVAEVV